ncbi:MAG: quinolinate synthase NadA, partial [Clostridia bacterium]|nr:quinolinate synthase NadA [Clostridia bacterium]
GAPLLVHPECRPEITREADFVGSTTEIMAYAKEGDADTYIIGTENSIVEHLAFDCPEKTFVPLSKDCVCHNMSITALPDLYRCLLGVGGEEIVLPRDVLRDARRPIDEMIRLGK